MSRQAQRLAAIAELEKIAIPFPDCQNRRPSLAQMIHCALVELADLRAEHDRRVTELIAANTREVERRRKAEADVARLRGLLLAEMRAGQSLSREEQR